MKGGGNPRRGRIGLRHVAAAAACACAPLVFAGAAIGTNVTTTTVSFASAGCSTWTVPSGVPKVDVSATGAAGASGGASGGAGDGVSATLTGLAGVDLTVCVDA